MVATVALSLIIILIFYFLLIIYCNVETCQNMTAASKNVSGSISTPQMCVDHYVDLLSKLLRQPIDILVYCANVISKNILQILISLGLCLSVYGWFSHAEQMMQGVQDIYHEIKQTTSAVVHEFCTVGQSAIVTVWTSLSIIKAVQFAFLLLLLIAVPDCIDYLKKALVRFAKVT